MTHPVENKLAALGITLPASPPPAANYVPYVISGNLVFISGQLPMENGKPQSIGKLGKEFTVEQGQATARLCAINILAQLKTAIGGDWSKVKKCVKLGVFVNSAPEFTDQPKVANGASDFLVEILGEAGKHSRAAVGVAQLPLGVSVEIDAAFEIA